VLLSRKKDTPGRAWAHCLASRHRFYDEIGIRPIRVLQLNRNFPFGCVEGVAGGNFIRIMVDERGYRCRDTGQSSALRLRPILVFIYGRVDAIDLTRSDRRAKPPPAATGERLSSCRGAFGRGIEARN